MHVIHRLSWALELKPRHSRDGEQLLDRSCSSLCSLFFFFFLLCRSYIRDSCTVMFLRTHRQHQLIGLICLSVLLLFLSPLTADQLLMHVLYSSPSLLTPTLLPLSPLLFFPLLPQMDRMNFLSFLLLCLTSVAIGNKGQFLILLTVNCEVLR